MLHGGGDSRTQLYLAFEKAMQGQLPAVSLPELAHAYHRFEVEAYSRTLIWWCPPKLRGFASTVWMAVGIWALAYAPRLFDYLGLKGIT